jgi:hypothetical protein
MATIKPYTIAVPDASLKRLHQKLELADLPKYQIEGAEWTYGTPLYVFDFYQTVLITKIAQKGYPAFGRVVED